MAGRLRALACFGSPDHPFRGEALKRGGAAYAEQPGDGHAALGNDDFVAVLNSVKVHAEMRAQLSDGYVHSRTVH